MIPTGVFFALSFVLFIIAFLSLIIYAAEINPNGGGTALIVSYIALALLLICSHAFVSAELKANAVKHDAAVWQNSDSGSPVFVWKDDLEKEKDKKYGK